jgi:hypothetical protein
LRHAANYFKVSLQRFFTSEVSGREYSSKELALELTAKAVNRHSMSTSLDYGDA